MQLVWLLLSMIYVHFSLFPSVLRIQIYLLFLFIIDLSLYSCYNCTQVYSAKVYYVKVYYVKVYHVKVYYVKVYYTKVYHVKMYYVKVYYAKVCYAKVYCAHILFMLKLVSHFQKLYSTW